MADVICGDCGAPMTLRRSTLGPFYGCTRWPACPGKHGAHPDGRPKGVPGDAATRAARIRAHAAFDPLWKGGAMSRGAATAGYHARGTRAKRCETRRAREKRRVREKIDRGGVVGACAAQ